MRHLSSVLLLAPAIASAQLRPAPLVATRELYIPADSARFPFWGGMLRDRNGTLFYANSHGKAALDPMTQG